MSNDWKPATQAEVDEVVQDELANLPFNVLAIYERLRVRGVTATIRRSEMYGDETVFVLARYANWVVYYDDVEDGFDLSAVDGDGRIERSGAGNMDLGEAVRKLDALSRPC